LLVVAEIIAYRYGQRQDDLTGSQQEATEKRHDEEMARLHVEAVRLSAEAEVSKKETEFARKDAAIAQRHADEARLALEKFRAPRSLTPEQQSTIASELSRFKGTRFDMAVIPGYPEAANFLGQISKTIQLGGWEWVEWAPPGGPLAFTYTWPGLPKVGQMGGFGIDIFIPVDRTAEFSDAANALANALEREGFSSGQVRHEVKEQGIPNHDVIHVVIGRKPQ
jgi:hypothetical protein